MTTVTSSEERAVAIVGVGLKAPGGNEVGAFWDWLLQGRSVAEPYLDERLPDGAAILVSRVTGFDPRDYLSPVEARRTDRCHQLAIGAAQDAIDQALADEGSLPPPERCGVVCGATSTYEAQHAALLQRGPRGLTPLTIPLVMPSSTAAFLSLRFGFQGPSTTVSSACASGAAAIGEAMELLRAGRADLVLAGGADAMLTYNALTSFLRLDVMSRNITQPDLASRPFDVDRDGFVMGEGAAFVLLERPADARARRHCVLGYLVGHGSTSDAHHLVAPPPDGAGAQRAIRLAVADAAIPTTDISHVNAHGTSTVLNDAAEAAAIEAVFGAKSPPVTAVKGATGHLIGGSGALEVIVTLWSLRQRLVPPIAGLRRADPGLNIHPVHAGSETLIGDYGLSNSFGFGGTNVSLVVKGP